MAWIQTRTGPFDFLSCTPMDFNIETIAHSLGNLCRWNGHTNRFYSVAEHSCLLAGYIEKTYPDDKHKSLAMVIAMLHDAPEAYLGDVTRPLKKALGDVYRNMEESILNKICDRYCVPKQGHDHLVWSAVKSLDDRICIDERRRLLPPLADESMWALQGSGLGVDVHCWSPHIAKSKYLEMWHRIGRMEA